MIIRGAGPSFCAGYDLAAPNHDVERPIAHADGWWSRHVVNNWFEMWDMATPIIGRGPRVLPGRRLRAGHGL